MSVDVDKLKIDFANERYDNLLEDWYMIKTSPSKDKSYYKADKNLDRFLLITLLESRNVESTCCLDNIKLF